MARGLSFGLEDRVAVVTGGSSGIGLATARLLLRGGARVAICGRNASRLKAAGQSLGEEAGSDRIYIHCCDVLDADGIGSFASNVATHLGPADILVNNAGEGRVSTFAATDDKAWRAELELKFFSVIRPTRAFLPQIEQSDAGSIVCVNSLLARQPEPHMVATSAARAGVLNLVRSLATDVCAPSNTRECGADRPGRIRPVEASLYSPGSAWRDVGSVDERARRAERDTA